VATNDRGIGSGPKTPVGGHVSKTGQNQPLLALNRLSWMQAIPSRANCAPNVGLESRIVEVATELGSTDYSQVRPVAPGAQLTPVTLPELNVAVAEILG